MGLPDLVKSKPWVALVISLLIGFFLGWLLMGWVIWPAQYAGEAYSYELVQPQKQQYVAALADSYKLTGNAKAARDALVGWDNADLRMTAANLSATLKGQGRTDEAKRVDDFVGALGLAAAPATTPGAKAAAAAWSWTSLLKICVGFVIIVLLVAAVLLVVDRRRRKPRSAAPHPAADRPATKIEPTSPALGRFESRYAFGDDSFDESFTVETGAGEFLGECGIGISETVESGPPDRITAFELWLFDKSDIRTVTKVLMSEYAFNDPAIRDKLAPKGDAVMAASGAVIQLETASLTLQARITELQYGSESQYANSYFENLAVEITSNPKAA
jgi:hypothetical protein